MIPPGITQLGLTAVSSTLNTSGCLEMERTYTTAWRMSSLQTPASSYQERQLINSACGKGFAGNAGEREKPFSNSI